MFTGKHLKLSIELYKLSKCSNVFFNLKKSYLCNFLCNSVGRTARAGKAGRSIAFVTQYDVEAYQRLEALIGQKLSKVFFFY